MKMPRVGLVTGAMHCGGVEAHLLRLAKYLAQHGFEPEVVVTQERGAWFPRVAEFGLTGVDLSENLPRARLLRAWEIGRRLAARSYDVVFLNHAMDAQASIAMLPDTTVVIPVLHNDFEGVYRVGCDNALAWNVAVAVSPRVLAQVQARVSGRPVVTIPYGVDLPSEAPRDRGATIATSLDMVFVGRLVHAQKGVFFLPPILRGCLDSGLDVSLTIAGDGPDRLELERRFTSLGLRSQVQFLGMLAPDQVYRLLLDADVLLMPSFFEGLPITLLEAQVCGCVPVVSRLPGITDVSVVDGETGFLREVGDTMGFVSAIRDLCNSGAKWQAMSIAGRDTVVREFTVETMGRAYVQLIEACLGGCYPLPRSRRHRPPVHLRVPSLKELVSRWSKRT